jgi:hypothetical protein
MTKLHDNCPADCHTDTISTDGGDMSTLVTAKELHDRDLFEMANGSAYAAGGLVADASAQRARMWCAHPPDPVTFEPPPIELPAEQEVRLLSGDDVKAHYHHAGFVADIFRREMDRRHAAMMHVVDERGQQEAAEQRRREHTRRPWWKKLFG